MSPSGIYEILVSMSSYINTRLHINELEAIMMTLLNDGIINEENVIFIRKLYLENIKWQSDNYSAVENWVFTNIKLNRNEMKKYKTCRELHNMKDQIILRKKRKFCES
jgi:hypothetical protein